MRILPLLLAALLPFTALAKQEDFSSRLAQEKMKCEELVEGFCDFVWAAPRLGNFEFRSGNAFWPLRFGKTNNDIPATRFAFLQSLKAHFKDLPTDIRSALRRTHFPETLDAFLNRKEPKRIKLADLSRPEFLKAIQTPLNDALLLVSWERAEKQFPGWIRLASDETSMEIFRAVDKHLDKAWSELFVAVWKKQGDWLKVKKMFAVLREEYRHLITEDVSLSATLRQGSLSDMDEVRLVIPGENLEKANDSKWHDCGIDTRNSFYNQTNHEVTVCAGDFVSASPLLALAHEMAHSYSLQRRLLKYYRESEYGKSVLSLWSRSSQGKHFSCAEWEKFKETFVSQVDALKPINYEDATILDKFITKELHSMPEGSELQKLADRFAKGTVRAEINAFALENILKPDEILPTGAKVPNFRFLNPVINYARWPKDTMALDHESLQFEMLFSEEYLCQLEQKASATDALRKGIDEAQRIVNHLWAMYLRVPGRFSPYQEALDEEIAQNIEEDLVDSISAKLVARLLKKNPSVQARRYEYLASIVGYCSAPSFLQKYPEEASVMSKYSNEPHSPGLERRRKMLTKEIREALACE